MLTKMAQRIFVKTNQYVTLLQQNIIYLIQNFHNLIFTHVKYKCNYLLEIFEMWKL